MPDGPKRVLAANPGETNATRRKAAGWLFGLIAVASAPIASRPAHAEPYPERTIRIVVRCVEREKRSNGGRPGRPAALRYRGRH